MPELRALHLTLATTVLEVSRGPEGPAALLHISDRHGFATIVASCAWSSPAAACLAAAEAGDRLAVEGLVSETRRSAWLPGETLLMAVESARALKPQRAVRSQGAKQ